MQDRKPKLQDYFDLIKTRLAKFRKPHLMSDKNSVDFYESFFDSVNYDNFTYDERRNTRVTILNNVLDKKYKKNMELLDIGCGFGEVLSRIPSQWKKYGIDYSESNVNVATKILGNEVNIQQGSIYNLPYKDNQFDVVICLEVLEHIEQDEIALKEINRVVKKDGLFIIAVPHTFYWPKYKNLIGHFRHYSRESLVEKLKQSFFSPIQYLPTLPNWHKHYAKQYFLTRILTITFGRFFGINNPYKFRWPFMKLSRMESIKKQLNNLYLKDLELNYSEGYFGTFIVAKKHE